MSEWPKLNLPEPVLRIEQRAGKPYVFDHIRRKWLVLTPEEWVRQHVIGYLLQAGYPPGLCRIEGGLKIGKMPKRADILVLDTQGEVFLLAECKAPQVPVNQAVLHQVLRYNLSLRAPFLLLSNGFQTLHLHLRPDSGQIENLEKLPDFPAFL
jgi:Type I restriction enzyme R protein N terminus (HSDR_N)